MLFTAAVGVVGALLELADVAFALEIGALEAVVEVGDVATDVTADVTIEEVETLSSLDNLSDIDPLIDENPVPVDNTPENPPQEAPVAAPQDAPAPPPQDTPADPLQDTPADPLQDTPADPPEDTPVEDPQTDEAPPNVDQPSAEPTPEPSKHDSGIDLSQDEQDLLAKILNDPKVSETPKEIAPQKPVQVNVVHTDEPVTSVTTSSPNEVKVVDTYPDGSTTTTTTYLPGEPEETISIIERNPDGQITSIITRNPDGSGNITRPTPQGPFSSSDEVIPPTRPLAGDGATPLPESPEYQPNEPFQPNEGPLQQPDSSPNFEPDSPNPTSEPDSPNPTPQPSRGKRPLEEPTEEQRSKQPRIDDSTDEPLQPQTTIPDNRTIGELRQAFNRSNGQLQARTREYLQDMTSLKGYEKYINELRSVRYLYDQLIRRGVTDIAPPPAELPPPS